MASILDAYQFRNNSIFEGLELTDSRKAAGNFENLGVYQFNNIVSFNDKLYKQTKEWQETELLNGYKVQNKECEAIMQSYLPVDFTFTPNATGTEGFTISSENNAAILIHSGTNPGGKQEVYEFTMTRTNDYLYEEASNSYHTYKDIADPGLHPGAVIKKTFATLGYVPRAITLILGAGGGGGGQTDSDGGAGGGSSGASIGVILVFQTIKTKYKITVGYYGKGSGNVYTDPAYDAGDSIIECTENDRLMGTITIPGGKSTSTSSGGAASSWKPVEKIEPYIYLLDYWNGRAGGNGSTSSSKYSEAGAGFYELPTFKTIFTGTTKVNAMPYGGAGNIEYCGGGGGASAAWSGGCGGGPSWEGLVFAANGKYGSGGGGESSGRTLYTTGGRGWFILVY